MEHLTINKTDVHDPAALGGPTCATCAARPQVDGVHWWRGAESSAWLCWACARSTGRLGLVTNSRNAAGGGHTLTLVQLDLLGVYPDETRWTCDECRRVATLAPVRGRERDMGLHALAPVAGADYDICFACTSATIISISNRTRNAKSSSSLEFFLGFRDTSSSLSK